MADTFSGRPARHGRPGSAGSKAGGKDSKTSRDGKDSRDKRPFARQAGRQGRQERRPSCTPAFRPGQELFPGFSRDLAQLLDQPLLRALRKAWPLSRAHHASLAQDIAELSGILTSSRADLRRPYWAKPNLTSAYLYYFLPWNLVRLCRLFGGLRLPEPAGDRPSILVDLGSGPLTVPLALWLAKPGWRRLPLEVVAVDCAGRPPRLGQAVLEALAEEAGTAPWKVRCVQSPLAMAARRLKPLLAGAVPFLITAANVLNELPPERRGRFEGYGDGPGDRTGMDGMDGEDGSLAVSQLAGMASEGSLSNLLSSLLPLLRARRGQTPPRLLFIEPGTRLGGSTLMELRALALDEGLLPLAPCPHGLACPLRRDDAEEDWLDGPRMASRLAGRTWCHFTFDAQGAPAWLAKLSVEAGLDKDSLSLACLDLAVPAAELEDCEAPDADGGLDGSDVPKADAPEATSASSAPGNADAAGEQATDGAAEGTAASPAGDASLLQARIVSQPFRVPGLRGLARYACTARGLALLEDAGGCPSGSLVGLPAGAFDGARRDAKSGAAVIASARTGGRPVPEEAAEASCEPCLASAAATPSGHAQPRRGQAQGRPRVQSGDRSGGGRNDASRQGQRHAPEDQGGQRGHGDHDGKGGHAGHRSHAGQSRHGRQR